MGWGSKKGVSGGLSGLKITWALTAQFGWDKGLTEIKPPFVKEYGGDLCR